MRFDETGSRLGYRGTLGGSRGSGILARVLVVIAGTVVLIGAIALSLVVLAVGLVALLVFGAHLWWKTRELRRHLRTGAPYGDVIEGEVVRDASPVDEKADDRPR